MIVLASASPRRRLLLEAAGVSVHVVRPSVDETWRGEEPVAFAERLAWAKATAVEGGVVIAADTVVHREGCLFDKPADPQAATDTLASLSGQWHRVTTAFVVRSATSVVAQAIHTEVRFRCLPDAEIEAYIRTGEPFDKAGAYGIQGAGGALVAELRGSYNNVVGLPLEEVLDALRRVTR